MSSTLRPDSIAFAPPATVADLAAPSGAACLNCAGALSGAYCAQCGQPAATGRLTLRALAREVFAQVVELDHGLLHTIVDLLRAPGTMMKGYLAGRRRKYTGPVTFVVLATAASLLRSALIPGEKAALDAKFTHPDPVLLEFFGTARWAMYTDLAKFVAYNKLVFDAAMLIPIMLAVRFLFRKRGVNLAESGVFTAYTFGEATFISVVTTAPFHLMGMEGVAPGVMMLVIAGYLLYAGFGMFGRSFSVAWRVLLALVVGMSAISFGVGLIPFLLIR
jgi:hypothetical protein